MATRTIQSPGVEIKEIDLSLRPVIPVGTATLVTGFAPQGPTDEVFEVTSFSEFEQVYGKPTNASERYFYHTARTAFNSDARILAARLPYGSANGDGFGSQYSALFYPVIGIDKVADAPCVVSATASLRTTVRYASGNPGHATKTVTESGSFATLQATASASSTWLKSTSLSATSANGGYVLGKPDHVQLTKTEYDKLKAGDYTWQDAVT